MKGDFASTQGQIFYLNKGAFNSLYNHDKLLVPIIVCKFFQIFSIENVRESVSMSVFNYDEFARG